MPYPKTYSQKPMPIGEFLKFNPHWLCKHTRYPMAVVEIFEAESEHELKDFDNGIFTNERMCVSIGSLLPYSWDPEYHMAKHGLKCLETDLGGLMGVFMDLSLRYSIYKIGVRTTSLLVSYDVVVTPVEYRTGCESNINADLVEALSNKMCQRREEAHD